MKNRMIIRFGATKEDELQYRAVNHRLKEMINILGERNLPKVYGLDAGLYKRDIEDMDKFDDYCERKIILYYEDGYEDYLIREIKRPYWAI